MNPPCPLNLESYVANVFCNFFKVWNFWRDWTGPSFFLHVEFFLKNHLHPSLIWKTSKNLIVESSLICHVHQYDDHQIHHQYISHNNKKISSGYFCCVGHLSGSSKRATFRKEPRRWPGQMLDLLLFLFSIMCEYQVHTQHLSFFTFAHCDGWKFYTSGKIHDKITSPNQPNSVREAILCQ